MTLEELTALIQQSENAAVDVNALPFRPVANASTNDLNMAALDSYFANYGFEFSKEADIAHRQLLINTDILAPSGEPTIGGLLMFGINPSRYLLQAAIMFAHFNGLKIAAELIDRQEIVGTLPQQVDAAVAVMKKYRDGGKTAFRRVLRIQPGAAKIYG